MPQTIDRPFTSRTYVSLAIARAREKLFVFGVRARPAPFYESDSETIQPLGNPQQQFTSIHVAGDESVLVRIDERFSYGDEEPATVSDYAAVARTGDMIVVVTDTGCEVLTARKAVVLATGSRPFAFIHSDNGSISRLVHMPGGRLLLRSFNDTNHLAVLTGPAG